MCDRWRNSFDLFLADMGKKPSPMMTIEREKNGEGYSPGNCVWATKKTQARNTRSNKIVHYHGRDMCLAEAVEIAGADYGLVALRIRRGWPLDRAISEPPNG